jgi:hypothetical protein
MPDLKTANRYSALGQPEEVAHLALSIVAGGMSFSHVSCIGLDGGISNSLYDPK